MPRKKSTTKEHDRQSDARTAEAVWVSQKRTSNPRKLPNDPVEC